MSTIESLIEIFTANRVKTTADELAQWGTDWTRSYEIAPRAVVFPESIDEVVALVELANEADLKLVPSGGRTGLSGGAVASNGEIVVSFDRMNSIVDYSPTDRLVRCQAGVVTAALQEYAQDRGLFYPVDFASSGSSRFCKVSASGMRASSASMLPPTSSTNALTVRRSGPASLARMPLPE